MLLQNIQPTPNTVAYLIAGYVVIFGLAIAWVVSLVVRRRNLQKDLESLKELEEEKR